MGDLGPTKISSSLGILGADGSGKYVYLTIKFYSNVPNSGYVVLSGPRGG